MNEEKTQTDSKLSSRKFVVWLVWLILTAGTVVYMFISKDSTLVEKTLDSFFYVSMMYLGMNVGQKVGFAISDTDSVLKAADEMQVMKAVTKFLGDKNYDVFLLACTEISTYKNRLHTNKIILDAVDILVKNTVLACDKEYIE